MLATMYSGIHWATDVPYGVVLGWVGVRIGRQLGDTPPDVDVLRERPRAAVERLASRGR